MAIKVFFLDETDELVKIPRARYEKLRKGIGKPYPEFAGRAVRFIHAMVELENGKPLSIRQLFYPLHEFDEQGQFNQNMAEEELRGMANIMSLESNEFTLLEHRRVHYWNPESVGEERLRSKIGDLIFADVRKT